MEDVIRDARDGLAAAVGRGDAAALAALYEDDAWLLSPSVELIVGRQEIEAYWQAGLAVGLAGVELLASSVRVIDALAIETGRYALALDTGADGGKYVVLHRRQADGTWRRAVDVFNADVKEER